MRRPPRAVTIALAVLHREGRVLLERRPPGGLLGGLWAFPEREIASPSDARAAAVELAGERGLDVQGDVVSLPPCEHAFTHLRATYFPVSLAVEAPELEVLDALATRASSSVTSWIDANRPIQLALPVAQQRVLASFCGTVGCRREAEAVDAGSNGGR